MEAKEMEKFKDRVFENLKLLLYIKVDSDSGKIINYFKDIVISFPFLITDTIKLCLYITTVLFSKESITLLSNQNCMTTLF